MPEATCDIGLIGLAVMGQNLVLNMNDHGFKVAVFNRTVSKVDDFLANEAKGTKVVGAHSIEELAGLLKRPRRVMLMVKAGDSVDQTIDHVLPYLETGDIIIDGGNSLFTDSNRRTKVSSRERHSLHRHRRLRRRRRRALRPFHHARRQSRRMAACEGDLPGHRRQGRRRNALLRLGRRRRRRPLRQDGAQRHRVRRHAADLRGLQICSSAASASPPTNSTRSSPTGTRASSTAISSRSPATSSPRRTKTASRWSTRSSTPPARKAPASGPSSARSTRPAGHSHRRVGLCALPLGAQGRTRRRLEDS